MINEAIILAGGLGTRLKDVIDDIPKPMAPVNNKPFLSYLFEYLERYKITKVILAVGYKYEIIEEYYGNNYNGIEIKYAIEHTPLGTGGGIANAMKYVDNNKVFLLNGDTFFDVNLYELYKLHIDEDAMLTLSLKEMHNFDRYGSVELKANKIIAFNEKAKVKHGFINGGVYVLDKSIFITEKLPKKFSFEIDIMENGLSSFIINGYKSDGYFIDIGIPSDYIKAQDEF
jgi:D-glycero-alpha-D-manno-heptose 1-phosphate guanylyltransferase